MSDADFQRARTPEQIAERRATILRAARELLAEQRLADISLRDLSARVGLAKSNVLRYFDTREGVFLAILDEEWAAWADGLEGSEVAAPGDEAAVAALVARTLADAPLLCELWGSLAGVLEQNVGAGTARAFKVSSTRHADRVERWILEQVPRLDQTSARQVAAVTSLLAGALSAYRRPAAGVAAVTEEFGGFPARSFEDNLRDGLHVYLVGATTLA